MRQVHTICPIPVKNVSVDANEDAVMVIEVELSPGRISVPHTVGGYPGVCRNFGIVDTVWHIVGWCIAIEVRPLLPVTCLADLELSFL
jgi:hypothetical protein